MPLPALPYKRVCELNDETHICELLANRSFLPIEECVSIDTSVYQILDFTLLTQRFSGVSLRNPTPDSTGETILLRVRTRFSLVPSGILPCDCPAHSSLYCRVTFPPIHRYLWSPAS